MCGLIMVHCVNDNERAGILEACAERQLSSGRPVAGDRTSVEMLGVVHGRDIVLLRSFAGSYGPGSSQAVVTDGIDDFQPSVVAAVGVAAGLKVQPTEGVPCVMIASRVTDYERVRLGTTDSGELVVRERGEVGNPNPILLGKLRVVADSAKIPSELGQMLCGEKLVDFPGFKKELRQRFPDAIGVEMESSGVAAACARRAVPWIMLKAASDAGDGTKNTFHKDKDAAQRAGARVAMSLLLSAVEGGQLS